MVLPRSIWVEDPKRSRTKGRVFRRPLGLTERGFYWDSVFKGTATTINHFELEIENTDAAQVLSRSNVERTWMLMKQTFPLLGSWVDEGERVDDADDDLSFVVDECRLSSITPGEVNIMRINSTIEGDRLARSILNSPTYMDASELVARLWIFHRNDQVNRAHVLFEQAHITHDGFAITTMINAFSEFLVHSDRLEQTLPALEDRLRLLLPSDVLDPAMGYSTARRRWRTAIAKVIYKNRQNKLHGGYALPRNITPTTLLTPGFGQCIQYNFPEEFSSQMIATCKAAGITVGQALPVLTQVAHSRMMYRNLREGKITVEEFERLRRQPMFQGGPLNLRPHLSKEWYENGGAGAVCLSIGFFMHALPFMPSIDLKHATNSQGDVITPPFLQLLPKSRFFHRCRLIKQQSQALAAHPLFVELSNCKLGPRLERTRMNAMHWRELLGESSTGREGARKPARVTHNVGLPPGLISLENPAIVYSNGCATLGNMDPLIHKTHEGMFSPPGSSKTIDIKLKVLDWSTYIRCRPAELYLSSRMLNKQLGFSIFWDENVYPMEMISAWFEELKRATEVYLGGEKEISLERNTVKKKARL